MQVSIKKIGDMLSLKIHTMMFSNTYYSKTMLSNAKQLIITSWLLLAVSSVMAQSLQWSQFTSPKPNYGNDRSNATISIVKVPNGAIYTLSRFQANSNTPLPSFINSTNHAVLGNAGTSSYGRIITVLSKYSSDGSSLLWTRTLAPSNSVPSGLVVTSTLEPLDLVLSPSGDPIVLTATNAPIPALITNDAYQLNAPPFLASGTTAQTGSLVLNYFDANGNITYGTYVGPTGGGITVPFTTKLGTTTPEFLKVASDGTLHIVFSSLVYDASFTGRMPITAGAFIPESAHTYGSNPNSTTNLMIFNSDHTLRSSTYLDYGNMNVSPVDEAIAPNGNLYVALPNNSNPIGYIVPPSNALNPNNINNTKGLIIQMDAQGQYVNSTFLPNGIFAPNDVNYPLTVLVKPNGNVLVATYQGDILEMNANLTTLINHFNPFNKNIATEAPNGSGLGFITDIALDSYGRIHLITNNQSGSPKPTTPGALQAANSSSTVGYYTIIDETQQKIVYATEIGAKQGNTANFTNNFYDIAVEGCNSYFVGRTNPGSGFPVTPTAYNNAGTATVSGYNVSTVVTATTGASDAVMVAFNYPVQKVNTNILTAPAISTFCLGSGILPIDGTKTTFTTPTILGKADASPAPTPVHYQWQIASNLAGPFTDISDSDKEDFSPPFPTTSGTFCYRRKVRQTPYEQGFVVPACDIEDISNVVCLTFQTDKSHATNIPEGKYGICKGGTALSLSYNIIQSTDGAFAPYTYKLTTVDNLTATALGQSGTIAAVSTPINLSVGVAGDYILQVTDSRGCTSFDTLKVENLNLSGNGYRKFTCGDATLKLGPVTLPPTYLNYTVNTFAWSPTTGLDNPNAASPTFTHNLAVGDSTQKFLTFNGCVVDSVMIVNQSITPLPTLPDLGICQGDTLRLGTSGPGSAPILVSQSGVSYSWAPGLGLTSDNVANPLVTTATAPAGVNEVVYTVLATSGNTGCVQSITQKVTTYRTPNQSFNLKECMQNGCTPTSTLQYQKFGTPAEPGISYSWTAKVVDDAGNIGNTGLPTDAEALSFLDNPTSSETTLNSKIPGLGYAAQHGYKIIYVRTSFNTANPACMRSDTAELFYCCGDGLMCNLSLGAVPTITCGGPDNKIGPGKSSSSGKYYWSRLDGQPLNNELFEVGTGTPLNNIGPHPFNVIANPSGVVAISYRLTFILDVVTSSEDTCRIDIKVFPGAISKPNVVYTSPQAVCQVSDYTIQGPIGQPALNYLWNPSTALVSAADSTLALPTIKGLNANSDMYVTVTDPITGCYVKDTVHFVVTPVVVDAGLDATFCTSGATVDIGSLNPISGYTYSWTAVPATGVSFGDPTKPITTATLPATTAGNKIILYLTATNGLTAANCSLTDSVVFTASTAPVITIPNTNALCTSGGTVTIGPISPSGASNTYTWSPTASIVSGQGTPSIVVNPTVATTYSVIVNQGLCTSTATKNVVLATNPTVTLNPTTPCATDVTIGATTMTTTQKVGWTFSWDKFDALTTYAADLSTITVRPTVTTTYTLTAKHISGCSKTYAIVVPAAAYKAELPNTLNFCEGQSAVLPLNDPSSVSGTVVWTANPTTGLAYLSSTTAVNPTINMTTAITGTYIYTATINYGAGCKSVASVTVNIGKKRENIAGLDQEICQGTCFQLGTTLISGMNYSWSATPLDATLTGTFSATPVVCPTEKTTYTLTYLDASGCTFEDEVIVQLKPSPTLTVTDTVSICQNATGTATIDLSHVILTNTGTTTTYWQNANTSVAATNPVNVPNTYYIKSENAAGCSASAHTQVLFYDLPEGTVTPNFNCTTTKGSLSISSTSTNVRYDYNIGASYTGGKTYSTATALVTGSTIVSNLPAPTFGEQTYTVRFFGSDGICFVDKIVVLTSAACPCPDNSYTFCIGETYTLTATIGLTNIQWQVDNGSGFMNITNATNPTYIVSAAGIYRYTAKDSNNCDIVVCCPYTFIANPVATANAGTPQNVCAGSTITLAGSIGGSATSGTWSAPSGTFSNANSLTSTYTPNITSGTVTLTLTTDDPTGPCPSATSTVVITVNASPSTPSVISPVMNPCPATTVNLIPISSVLTPSVSGGSFEWHVSNSSGSALVSTPTAVGNGTYYLFEKSTTDCYSSETALQVQIQVCCPTRICLPVTVTRSTGSN